MKVVFRADASLSIGTGHVARCRTLAEELRARHVAVSFISRAHQGHMIDALRQDCFDVQVLPPAPPAETRPNQAYASWLGVSEAQDAADTIAALGGVKADWLIVDHYALSTPWEQQLRPHAHKILAIDDLGRTHDTDAVLDQNYSRDAEVRYHHAQHKFLGPRYALLRHVYVEARAGAGSRGDAVRKIAVFFGGTDPENVTMLALEALNTPELSSIEVDVVVGSRNPNLDTIKKTVMAQPRTVLHIDLPNLVQVFAAADMALGAGGGAMWERCSLGLPTIVVTIAQNQEPSSRDLDSAGFIRYAGPHAQVTPAELRSAIVEFVADSATRQVMSQKCFNLVDGLGAKRVAEAIHATAPDQLVLRPATEADREFYFDLANHPTVRAQAFHSSTIPWQNHVTWFAAKLASPKTDMYVFEAAGLAVGQIRFDCDGSVATIDYALDPLVRGRGWGLMLVRQGVERAFRSGITKVRAEVKTGNAVSCAVFERAGFKIVCLSDDEKRVYVLEKGA
jgi:UDP-2,4-diacetamido-2,4,6-trideoxy-beta-L-altropyranose hydrolase